MNRFNMLTRGSAFAILALSATAAQEGAPAPEQTPEKGQKAVEEKPAPKVEPVEVPELTFDDIAPQQDAQAQAQQEMIELFGKVERRLKLIDSMLLDASAGETSSLNELTASGIDDLIDSVPEAPSTEQQDPASCQDVGSRLGQSSGQGRQALEEIDRIITIAKSLPSECKSGATKPGEKPKPGGSPVDQPQGSRERSQGPEKPKEGGEDPGGEKPDKKHLGEDPKGNQESEEDPSNKPAHTMPTSETGTPPQVTDQRDQWGDLPVHVRDVFRAEGGPGMPAQYRDWIDAYYRRLNSRASD